MKTTILTIATLIAFNANAWVSELPFDQDITDSNANEYIYEYENFIEKESLLTGAEVIRIMLERSLDEKDYVLAKWFERMHKDHPEHKNAKSFEHAFYRSLFDQLVYNYIENDNLESLLLLKEHAKSNNEVRALGAQIALLRIKMS